MLLWNGMRKMYHMCHCEIGSYEFYEEEKASTKMHYLRNFELCTR